MQRIRHYVQSFYQAHKRHVWRFAALYVLFRVINWIRERRRIAARARAVYAQKKHAQYEKWRQIYDSLGKPTPEMQAIVGASATELQAQIAKGTYTARQVADAFLRQAAEVHRHANVLTEVIPADRVFSDADGIDELDSGERKSAGQRGAMAGVPVSLKDTVGLRGLDSSIGTASLCGVPSIKDALVARLLRDAGALLYAKTAVPQTMLSFECRSPIFGRTLNVTNGAYVPGGSSGGEAALIRAGGSVLGIGTDIGGSIRIPAHFSGICALKPTSRRVSKDGFVASTPGQQAIPSIAGPMGRHVNDLALFMRTVVCEKAFREDPELVPLPFNDTVYSNGPTDKRELRVGYYTHDGFLGASPACARAVMKSVGLLHGASVTTDEGDVKITCVPFNPPDVPDAVRLFYQLVTADNAKTISALVKGEVLEDYTQKSLFLVSLPRPIKRLVGTIARALGQPNVAMLAEATGGVPVDKLWKVQLALSKYKARFRAAMRQAKIDVILCPGHTLPAVPHGSFTHISFSAAYTFLYNLLDYPAGVVPVTHVRPSDKWTGTPKDSLEKKCRRFYDAKQQTGLPVGCQVVSGPYDDELVLFVMRALEGRVRDAGDTSFAQPSMELDQPIAFDGVKLN